MALEDIQKQWLKNQAFELKLSTTLVQKDTEVFSFTKLQDTDCKTELWAKADDDTLYKQVIHINKIDTFNLKILAEFCIIHNLACEIKYPSWYREGYLIIELIKQDLLRDELELLVEKKTLLEA